MSTTQSSAEFLAEAIILGSGVEATQARERRDQKSVAASDNLPIRMEPKEAREFLAAAGIRFFESTEAADLFVDVELPAGWKKVASSHPLLTMLVDNRGRQRARIVVKFADRLATLILQPRYGLREGNPGCSVEELLGTDGPIVREVVDGGIVGDAGTVFHRVEIMPESNSRQDRFRAHLQAGKKATAWLDDNYPTWRNPETYWD